MDRIAHARLADAADTRYDPPRAEEVATGTGASIVVTAAAVIAIVIAVTIAVLGNAAAASPADPFADPMPTGSIASSATVAKPASGLAYALLGVPQRPARDGLYRLALPAPHADKSLAMAVVAGLFLVMTGAAGVVWRAAGSAFGAASGRRGEPARIRRSAGPAVRSSGPDGRIRR